MSNDVCSFHPDHLIPPTNYDLVGNIWLHLGTRALTDLQIKKEDVRTLDSLGLAQKLKSISNTYMKGNQLGN